MILTVGGSGGGQIERKCSLAESGWHIRPELGGHRGFFASLIPQFALTLRRLPRTGTFHIPSQATQAFQLCYQKPGILIVALDGSRSLILILTALVACPDLRPHPARAFPTMQSDVLYLCVRPSDSNKYLPARRSHHVATHKVSYF